MRNIFVRSRSTFASLLLLVIAASLLVLGGLHTVHAASDRLARQTTSRQALPTPTPLLLEALQDGRGYEPMPPAWPAPTSVPTEPIQGLIVQIPPLLHPVTLLSQPAATDFAISALPATSEESPSIDGNKVIWFDDRTHGPTDVWGYDLATGQQFQITNHPSAQFIADISGDVVVYEDNRNGTWDIYGKHLSTGQEFVIATGPNHQRYPRVWADYVVYQDETSDYFQSDVYLYRISTGATTPLAVAQSYQGRPDIDNGWIVWTDWRSGSWQLAVYRISTGAFSFRSIDCDDGCQPRVHDHEVVWNGWRVGSYDIYLYDLAAGIEHTVYAGSGDQRFPGISDTLIVWQDESTFGNWNVFVYVRANGTIFPVTLEPSRQQQPAVYGNTVVWQDNRSHTWDIYGLIWDGTVPPGTTPSLLNPRDLHVGAYPNREIRLSWTDNVPNEQGFVIQRATGIFGTQWADWVILPPNTTSYVDTSASLRESYWYRVRAYNASGTSSYSNESYSTAFDTVPNLDERYMHVLINEARMAPEAWGYPGLTPVNPLGWNANLAYSARAHALGMNNSNCCQGHTDLAGRGPSERADDSGYPYGAGENLFQATSGREGMESAHQGFMNSEGHRNNMMGADNRLAAIGFAPGGRGTLVEVFSGGPVGTVVPALPSGAVVPYRGLYGTMFDYLVSFWNPEMLAPSSALVIIDGVAHPLVLRSGIAGRGTYRYSTTLPEGNHSYHFEFVWGNPAQSARFPESGDLSGPHVGPYAWYVDSMVTSLGDGRTPDTAFKTIAEGLANAIRGDSVYVAAGTYPERFTIPQGVRLLGSGSERTTIDGGGSPGSVVHLDPDSTIEGFTITGSGPEYFDSGIWHSTGEVYVLHNRFTANTVGIFTWCWDPSCGAIANIKNNLFIGNTRVAVDANNEAIHRVVNNTVVGNGRGVVMNNASSITENSIVAQNAGDGVIGNNWNPTVRYNDVWSNGINYVGVSPGTGSISADPRFVNPVAGNYHLQSNSPAINAGNPGSTYNDRDGSRNDMGTYGGPCTGYPCAPVADFDGDGAVTVLDIAIIAEKWYHGSSLYDLNWDSSVTVADIEIAAGEWQGQN